MEVPNEIVLKILDYLSVADIVNFSLTCNYYQNLCNDDNLWKSKYSQKFLLADQKKLRDGNWKIIYKEEYQPKIDIIKHCFYRFNVTSPQEIEKALIDVIEKKIRQILDDKKNAKIILCCQLLQTAELFVKRLSDCQILLIRKNNIRDDVDKFNVPNTEIRVLISTLGSIESGVDLGDKNGSYQRYLFILLPHYPIIAVNQLAGRVIRFGNKSHSVIELIDQQINQDSYQYDGDLKSPSQCLQPHKYIPLS